jgi:hypothetical protein
VSNLTLNELTESLVETVSIVQSMNSEIALLRRETALLRSEVESNRNDTFNSVSHRENLIEQMSFQIDSMKKVFEIERVHTKNLIEELQGVIRILSEQLNQGRNFPSGGNPNYSNRETAPNQLNSQPSEHKNNKVNPHPSQRDNGYYLPPQVISRSNTPRRQSEDLNFPFDLVDGRLRGFGFQY